MVIGGWLLTLLLAQPSVSAEYQRAQQLFAHNDLTGASAAVEESLRGDPDYVPSLILKARLSMIAGAMDVAERSLRTASSSEPKNRQVRFLLGFCLYLENDFDDALTVLAAADQNDARTMLYTGLAHEGLGQDDAAAEAYRRAVSLDAANTEAHIAFGRLMRKQGKTEQAERHIDEALKLSPGARDALYEKGQCQFDRGEYLKAAETGELALAAKGPAPAERDIRFLLTRAYFKAGNREMAAKHRAVFESLPMPLVR